MRRAMARQATVFALGCALAWPVLSQGLFDDNEARRRIELLRQQVEASQKALEDRLGKFESSAGERSARLDLAGQLAGCAPKSPACAGRSRSSRIRSRPAT